MEKRNKAKRRSFLGQIRADYKNRKPVFVVYAILNAAILALLVFQIYTKNYPHVFTCAMSLFLCAIPSLVECKLKINVPSTLKILLMLFVFSTQIVGEVCEFYVKVSNWDKLMHIISGFFCGAFGLSMLDLLNRDGKAVRKLSPFFAVMVAFCFAITVGVLWEFFEFQCDTFLGYDMQKDTWITTITSVSLHPEGKNSPVTVDIESVVINGEEWPAYLDIGLIDTMEDLIVAAAGAGIFSVIAYIYMKRRSMGSFMRNFMLTRAGEEGTLPEGPPAEAKIC